MLIMNAIRPKAVNMTRGRRKVGLTSQNPTETGNNPQRTAAAEMSGANGPNRKMCQGPPIRSCRPASLNWRFTNCAMNHQRSTAGTRANDTRAMRWGKSFLEGVL